jgi:hypothetical protein
LVAWVIKRAKVSNNSKLSNLFQVELKRASASLDNYRRKFSKKKLGPRLQALKLRIPVAIKIANIAINLKKALSTLELPRFESDIFFGPTIVWLSPVYTGTTLSVYEISSDIEGTILVDLDESYQNISLILFFKVVTAVIRIVKKKSCKNNDSLS